MQLVITVADHAIQQGATGKAHPPSADSNNTRPLESHGNKAWEMIKTRGKPIGREASCTCMDGQPCRHTPAISQLTKLV
ncbi:hypothetical protein PVAP13_3KG340427 [Panicum virgatum]|uniref:SWIM-type domain-containing protein n=1 Tax=Panicum virgatum TaxID=38727 RepID=A0A8T0UU69_PANVG|nr:hypothetical protein PVAP13_3KG340427 [Panicum virgatum]